MRMMSDTNNKTGRVEKHRVNKTQILETPADTPVAMALPVIELMYLPISIMWY